MLGTDQNMTMTTPYGRLVRTGVIGDGSCFLHSILRGICPPYIIHKDQRRRYIQQLRIMLSDRLVPEIWESLSEKELAKGQFTVEFEKVKNYVWDRKNSRFSQKFQDVLTQIPYREFDNFTTQLFSRTYPERTLNQELEIWIQKFNEHYPDKKTQILFRSLCKISRNRAYHNFLIRLRDPHEWVDEGLSSAISHLLNLNIFVLDKTTRQLYETFRAPSDKAVIVVYLRDLHFEVAGQQQEDKTIKREFSLNDELIRKL